MTDDYRKPRLVTGPVVRDWIERGACVGSDVDVFFPGVSQSASEARRICATCTVRDACLDYAIEYGEQFGIFGGKNRDERNAIARARAVGAA